MDEEIQKKTVDQDSQELLTDLTDLLTDLFSALFPGKNTGYT
jgi:hypothetical protein